VCVERPSDEDDSRAFDMDPGARSV
jgi:hypothetical protein